ncbi:MAG: hypothetical protein IKU11_02535, partial [Clostridia bacterium]|nr:hypothetical protein [Clostridia bacterium]
DFSLRLQKALPLTRDTAAPTGLRHGGSEVVFTRAFEKELAADIPLSGLSRRGYSLRHSLSTEYIILIFLPLSTPILQDCMQK